MDFVEIFQYIDIRSCARKTDEEQHECEPDVEAATPLKWDKDDDGDDEWVCVWR